MQVVLDMLGMWEEEEEEEEGHGANVKDVKCWCKMSNQKSQTLNPLVKKSRVDRVKKSKEV